MNIEKNINQQVAAGYEFLLDPELRQLHVTLSESFISSITAEERIKNLKKFSNGIEKISNELEIISKNTPARLKQIMLFVRQEMLMLDAGGVAHGRSIQYEILLKLFHRFAEQYPDIYKEVVK